MSKGGDKFVRNLIFVILVVVVLALSTFFLVNKKKDQLSKTTGESTTTTSNSESQKSEEPGQNSQTPTVNSGVTITFSNSGFSPNTVRVGSGGTITVKNDSTNPLQFNSNPHPAHTDNAELNLGLVEEGQAKSLTVTKPGTWGFHDHLDSSFKGSIIVD